MLYNVCCKQRFIYTKVYYAYVYSVYLIVDSPKHRIIIVLYLNKLTCTL